MHLANLILIFIFLFVLFAFFNITSTYGIDSIKEDSLTVDNQIINQINTCEGKANCDNQAIVRYFAFSENGTLIISTSNYTVTQINRCSNDANCMNTAFLTNPMSSSETAEDDSGFQTNLNQSCYKASGNCLNFNELTVSGSGESSAFLDYVNSQSNNNVTKNNIS